MNTKYTLQEVKEKIANAKVLLFDFDGTLVNLDKLNVDGFAIVLKDMFGIDFTREDFMKYVSGKGARGGISEFLEIQGIKDFSTKEIISQFHSNKKRLIEERLDEEIYLIPGIDEFITHYDGKKRKIVVTSSREEHVKRMLTHFGIFKHFEKVFDRFDVVRGKPAPEAFETAMEYAKVTTDECVAFEDSFYGLQSAKGAGLFTVGILNKGWNDDFVYQLADYVVEEYTQLLDSE
jgi:HAD superfamily hydrolase (TIGR01509 family)